MSQWHPRQQNSNFPSIFISSRDRGFLDPEQQLTYGGGHQSSGPAAPATNSTTQPTAAITKTMLVNTGEMIFIYIIPALLHLGGFVMAAYIYRFADNEQLQCLIERVRPRH